jgi:endonuclease/exonuclease/phosphatase family metal-dependent hydrolase
VAAPPELSQYEKDGLTSDKRYNTNLPANDTPKRIDYIFTLGDDRAVRTLLSKMVFDQPVNGRFLSDHFGLIADLEFAPVEPELSTTLVSAPAHEVVPVLH